ncbi:hypothetical protein RFI_26796, partial [Reticulomyxa filosa]
MDERLVKAYSQFDRGFESFSFHRFPPEVKKYDTKVNFKIEKLFFLFFKRRSKPNYEKIFVNFNIIINNRVTHRSDCSMSDLKEEKMKGKDQTGATSFSFDPHSCFDKNWILYLNKEEQINHFICLVCNQVTSNPVEINCPQHEDTDEILIAGENCLKKLLINNNNTCPIQFHDGCQYSVIKSVRQLINDIT